jgi:hypothetical protein
MLASGTQSEMWLVRTSENIISGPFEKEHVRRLILEGELGLQDEICCGNSYWIYLHEAGEVQAQLQIEVPPQSAEEGTGDIDELTQTQTDALESDSAGTTVVRQSGRKTKRAGSRPIPRPASITPKVKIEPPTLWRGFALTLVLSAIAILVAVLRALSMRSE